MHQELEESKFVPEETTIAHKPVDVMEEGVKEDKKRIFMVPLRPHERIWNFYYDNEKDRPKHVLRPEADPAKCYIDGRIEALFQQINQVAVLLKSHTKERWDKLNLHVLEIFRAHERDEETAYKVYSANQNQ